MDVAFFYSVVLFHVIKFSTYLEEKKQKQSSVSKYTRHNFRLVRGSFMFNGVSRNFTPYSSYYS